MSWFSKAWSDLSDWTSSAVPNEVKRATPKELQTTEGALLAAAGGAFLGPVLPSTASVALGVGNNVGDLGATGIVGAVSDPAAILNTPAASGVLGAAALNGLQSVVNPKPIGVAPLGGAPTYDKTILDAFNAQLAIQDALLEGNKKYQPQYATLSSDIAAQTAQRQMDLMAKLYSQSGTIEAAYQNQLREAELKQLQSTLPGYQQAINALTPGYAQAIGSMGQLAQQAALKANQPVQLTNFESQVASPYGPAQVSMREGGPAQLGTAQATSQYGPPQVLPRANVLAPAGMPATGFAPVAGVQGPAMPSGPLGVGGAPVSAAGGPAIPGVSAGQMQGPQQAYQQAFQNQQQAIQAQGATPQGPAPAGLQNAVAGQYAATVPQLQTTAPITQLGQTAAQAAAQAGVVPDAVNLRAIVGPQLQSGLENINRGTVDQYLATMPGMADYAQKLSQISQQELAAGRNLSAEEQRMADQVARSAYAARGTALGPQAVGAEILNRADVQNQRFQERLGTAQRAAGQIQGIYQPALQQSYDRQLSGLQYGLTAQQQAFGQAQAKDTMAAAIQAQRYGQAMGTQGAGFSQLLGQENLLQGAQQQAYQQAMGREALLSSTQQSAFNQALQRNQAEQQRLQGETAIQAGRAQLGAGALGQLQAAQTPIINAYYKQPLLQQTVGQAQTMGLAAQQAAGNTLFNPESPMAFQSAFLPYQSNIALQTAQMQANAAKSAGQSAMIGNIIGAAAPLVTGLMLCWVAREVYGTETGTWKMFRSWMLEEAPEWLRNAYIKYGPQIAEFIKDKPVVKSVIRRWMDSKIESYLTA